MALTKVKTTNAELANLEIEGTEASRMPVGTTAQRANAQVGDLRHNSDLGVLEQYTSDGWTSIAAFPTIASISPSAIPATDSSFDITITGSNFSSGATVKAIGQDASEITASTVTRTNATTLVATFNGTSFSDAQEDYDIKVTNSTGLATTYDDSLSVNASPVWTTASGSLGSFNNGDSVSVSVAATDADGNTLTYSIASGDSLPTGLSLNSSTGAITGTASESAGSSTATSFDLEVSDGTNTAVSRGFSITTVGPDYPTNGLTLNLRARDQSYSTGNISSGTSLTMVTSGILAPDTDYGDAATVRDSNLYFEAGLSTVPSGKGFYLNGAGAINLSFSSASNYNDALNNAASQSTTVWFRMSSNSARQCMLSRYGSGFPNSWNQVVDPNGEFHYNSTGAIPGAGADVHNGSRYSLNTWHLWHKVYDVSTGKFYWYIDGVEVDTTTPGTDSGNGLTISANNTSIMALGCRGDGIERLTNTYVTECRMYNRALTASEVAAEWNATKGDYGRS